MLRCKRAEYVRPDYWLERLRDPDYKPVRADIAWATERAQRWRMIRRIAESRPWLTRRAETVRDRGLADRAYGREATWKIIAYLLEVRLRGGPPRTPPLWTLDTIRDDLRDALDIIERAAKLAEDTGADRRLTDALTDAAWLFGRRYYRDGEDTGPDLPGVIPEDPPRGPIWQEVVAVMNRED